MSTLKSMLTAVEVKQECSWQDALEDVQLAMNCTVNRVTKATPIELMFGKIARPLSLVTYSDKEKDTTVDVHEIRNQAVQNINKNSAYDKKRFDSTKAKVCKFSVGDFALIENDERNQTKLAPKFKGPYQIIEVLENDRYLLKAFNSNRTYKYAHDRLRKMPTELVQIDVDSDDSLLDEEDQPSTSRDTEPIV
uniref:Uncharacterized protein n=1 Tax=Lygus hesperus TaxID=30085 RepID=A0A0A9WJF5_LYGHE